MIVQYGETMDPKNNFSEEDKQKVVKFLNMVASSARFDLDTAEIIEYFKLLAFMQQILIPKIDKHCLEVLKVVEPEPVAESDTASSEGE